MKTLAERTWEYLADCSSELTFTQMRGVLEHTAKSYKVSWDEDHAVCTVEATYKDNSILVFEGEDDYGIAQFYFPKNK